MVCLRTQWSISKYRKKEHSEWPFAAELVVLFSTVDIISVDYVRLVISAGR